MTEKAYIYTLGCRVNLYETDSIRTALSDIGFSPSSDPTNAGLVIINSCAVTEEAARKSIKKARQLKRLNPDSFLIFCGCGAEENRNIINEDCVDAVVGSVNKTEKVSKIARAVFEKKNIEEKTVFDTAENDFLSEPFVPSFTSTRAFIKIQDGCNMNCSYCIIPFLRGRSRSRNKDEILKEIKSLSRKFKDITLTGIELSAYKYDLIELCREISKIGDIKRIRLGSLDPRYLSRQMIADFAKIGKISPHFHLSVQSGSNKILRDMNRNYTRESVIEKVSYISDYYNNYTLSADIIAGFPGESVEDFNDTYDLCKELSFMHIHAFPYSKRKFTKASEMDNQIDESIKKERVRRLNFLGDENYFKIKQRKILSLPEDVLFENENDGLYCGRYNDYSEVFVKSNEDISGKILKVKAIKTDDNNRLLGEII